jgi:DNA-binding CsgD family transcriptional regulator
MTLEHGNDLLAVAGRVCTAKQLEVIRLHETGLGWKRIALILGVSPDTVRSHHRAAVHKIVKEVERVEATRGSSAGET